MEENTTKINKFAQEQIDQIANKCQQIQPLVVVRCITYNHEPYIRDALDGFVMQKTNFPFVAIVHDDASSDNTAKIIQEYAEKFPDIIKPIYETENQYSKRVGSVTRIMNASVESTGAKYIAYCEGDDYWTDPLKLQKQVDFLEQNPDYGLVYSQVKRFNQANRKIIDTWGGCAEDFRTLLINNCIPTPTVLIRNHILNDYIKNIEPYKYHWQMGDYPIWLYASAVSKVKFINEPLAVYRILQNSASHFDSYLKMLRFRLSGNEIKIVIGEKFGANIRDYLSYQNTLLIQIAVLTSSKSDILKLRRALLGNSFKSGINFKIRLRCALLAFLPNFGTHMFERREFPQ